MTTAIARRVTAAAVLVWFCAFGVGAQQKTSAMTVTVDSSEKVPIAGAKVTVTNERTKQASVLTTDVNGSSLIDPLPAGQYVVECSAKGFVPKSQTVKVKPGKKAKVHARLKSTTPKKKSRWLQ